MIKEKIKQSKSRRVRRGNRKPGQPYVKGFRRGSRTERLHLKFQKVIEDDKKNQVEWLYKNIKSVKDVLGWCTPTQSNHFRSLKNEDISSIIRLFNQDDLINYCEVVKDKKHSKKEGVPIYRNKHEDPSLLVNFMEMVGTFLQEMGVKVDGIGPHPKSMGTMTMSSCMDEHFSFYLKKHCNTFTFKSDKINFHISQLKDGLELHNIEVFERGNGLGTMFLDIVKNVSDLINKPIYLFPIDYRRVSSNSNLRRWYVKRGFNRVESFSLYKYTPKVGGKVIQLHPINKEKLKEYGMVG